MTAIDDKYRAVSAVLGAPTSDEAPTRDGQGRYRLYERGVIMWHPSTGAHEIHGAILAKWRDAGSESGSLGYPLTDESAAQAGARFNHFVNGSIYWTAAHGAHVVPPHIREKWETMGWEGSVGFPVADPVDVGTGEVHQRFERAALSYSAQRGVSVTHEPKPVERVARVFLVGWADLAPAAGYTREFFDRYFFGTGEQFTNPDGGRIPGSVADYFGRTSDGNLRITGAVDDWVRSPLRLADLPHWYDGVVFPPNRLRMYGAVVTEALRRRGIRTSDQLKVNGRPPDVLVFASLDVWSGGGATRNLWDVRADLAASGKLELWDSAWEAFAHIPVVLISVSEQSPHPEAKPDGTFAAPPDLSRIRWASNSVIHHELVHALLGMDEDVYGGRWGFDSTWFEIMSNTVHTDHHVPMGSFVQERCGFMSIENLPRRTHGDLTVDPLETHSAAFRLSNGPLHAPETLVVENRARFDYARTPPARLSNIILAYSMDTSSRRVLPNGTRLTGRIIAGPAPWREAWGVPEAPELLGTGADLGNSLNHLGERWWELRAIRSQSDGSITLDAVYQPQDLIRRYPAAEWTNSAGVTLTPDDAGGSKGHVMMVGRSRPIAGGLRYHRVLSVHPDWTANGHVKGTWAVAVPASGAKLYVTCALSEQAEGSDGVGVRIAVAGRTAVEQQLTLQRNIRTFVVDLSARRGTTVNIELLVGAGGTAARDWAYILEATVVPTAMPVVDLLQSATTATYRGNAGPITFNGPTDAAGYARVVNQITLQNGTVYAGPVLHTHPTWRNDGFIEASFPVTLPTGNSVLRTELGFDEKRTNTDNGARFSARFVSTAGGTTTLLNNGRVSRQPAMGGHGLVANPALSTAIVLPQSIRGQRGHLVLRVDADGSAAQDWIYWTMAKVTTD